MADEVNPTQESLTSNTDVAVKEPALQVEIPAEPVLVSDEPIKVEVPTELPEQVDIEQTAPTDTSPDVEVDKKQIETPSPQTASADNKVMADRQMENPPVQTAQMGRNEPFVAQILSKARLTIQGKKRKKLDKIMLLLEKKQSITNDEVEKLLHVSDATATRYLSILEKEGKIKHIGKTGKGVSYSRL